MDSKDKIKNQFMKEYMRKDFSLISVKELCAAAPVALTNRTVSKGVTGRPPRRSDSKHWTFPVNSNGRGRRVLPTSPVRKARCYGWTEASRRREPSQWWRKTGASDDSCAGEPKMFSLKASWWQFHRTSRSSTGKSKMAKQEPIFIRWSTKSFGSKIALQYSPSGLVLSCLQA